MATYTREKLSGSTNGLPVKVAATASPGTTIHTAVSGTTSWDEIYLWLTNTYSAPVAVTVQFGGTTDPDHSIVKTLILVPNSPPEPILTGQIIQNSLDIKIFANLANVILATGYVNRITA